MARWFVHSRAARRPIASRSALRGPVRLMALATAGLLALSCSKRLTDPNDLPDPSQFPEGQASTKAELVVYLDTPNRVLTFVDNGVPGPDTTDRVIGTQDFYTTGPGAVQGMIFDSTSANQFEVYRREGAGYRQFKDFAIKAAKVYLQSKWEAYKFADSKPVPPPTRHYLGRGIVSGVSGKLSPLTNTGRVSLSPVAGTLDFTAPTGVPPDFRFPKPDSLLYMEWEAVPGAVGYWVHVYQLTDQAGDEIIRSGIPAPLYLAVTRDYFVGYFPEATAARPAGFPTRRSYRIGVDPLPAMGRMVTQRTLLNSQLYLVRVAAIGAAGELLAYTGESEAIQVFRLEGSYRAFPLGGALVNTFAPPPTPGPTRLGPVPGFTARTWMYPGGTFPHRRLN